jgi:hypothetical protein
LADFTAFVIVNSSYFARKVPLSAPLSIQTEIKKKSGNNARTAIDINATQNFGEGSYPKLERILIIFSNGSLAKFNTKKAYNAKAMGIPINVESALLRVLRNRSFMNDSCFKNFRITNASIKTIGINANQARGKTNPNDGRKQLADRFAVISNSGMSKRYKQ